VWQQSFPRENDIVDSEHNPAVKKVPTS